MKLYLLFGQRVCSYPGQYAPELIDAVDEYTDEDNSEYFDAKYKDACSSGEFSSVIIASTHVDSCKLDQLLSVNLIESSEIEIV